MPHAVSGSYKDPLSLRALLLDSYIFTKEDIEAVIRTLVLRLVERHGEVDVPTNSGYFPLLERIKTLPGYSSIVVLLMSIDDYGGKEVVLADLADIMQPYWINWWKSSSWDLRSTNFFERTLGQVLGRRQIAWINAQIARTVFNIIDDTLFWDMETKYSEMSLNAIELAEKYAANGDESSFDAAYRAGSDILYYLDQNETISVRTNAHFAACEACAYLVDVRGHTIVTAIRADAEAMNTQVTWRMMNDKYARLIRRLITPTLVTGSYG